MKETTTDASASKDSAAPEGWEEISASDGEQKPETKEPEVKAEVKEDSTQVDENHPTKLGRKVKDLTETVTTMAGKIDAFLAAQTKPQEKELPRDVSERHGDLYDQMCAIEPPPVEYVTTPKEQVLVRQWEQRTLAKIQNSEISSYTSSYMGKMKDMAEEGGELHAQIVHMITADGSPYNRKRTGNGGVDAELNYDKAHKAILSGKEKPKTSFGRDDKAEGTGITIPTGKEAVIETTVKLDPDAEAYAQYLGWNAEDRAAALKRPIVGASVR